jgi:hypothetical protein
MPYTHDTTDERNALYTDNEAQAMSKQRRLDTKPSPLIDDRALMGEVKAWFKKDL